MVEKIIVNPQRVRGYGNIVNVHDVSDYEAVGCTILEDTDTINDIETVVYVIEAEDSSISVVLSSSADSCYIGDSVVLTATVLDDGEPIEGGTVTFKLNTTTLGTDETDANGVATYTVVTSDVGSLNFTAYYEDHNSNTVSVVVSHDYSISFSQSSYTATGGTATLECTLLDNNVPVEGATISFSGSDSSLYSGITNSNGVASVTVTGISVETTFTCSYSNISDSCTVTVGPIYWINDDASVDNSSTLFGNSIALRNSGSNTTGWNSNGYYTVKTSTSTSRESMRVLAPLTGVTDAFVLEYDSYSEQSDGTSGLVVYNSSTAWEKLSDDVNTQKKYWYGYNDGTFHEQDFYGSATTYQRWVHYKFTIDGASFSIKVTDPANDDATIVERTETLHFTRGSTTQYGLNSEWSSNRTTRYKNIVAYKL